MDIFLKEIGWCWGLVRLRQGMELFYCCRLLLLTFLGKSITLGSIVGSLLCSYFLYFLKVTIYLSMLIGYLLSILLISFTLSNDSYYFCISKLILSYLLHLQLNIVLILIHFKLIIFCKIINWKKIRANNIFKNG